MISRNSFTSSKCITTYHQVSFHIGLENVCHMPNNKLAYVQKIQMVEWQPLTGISLLSHKEEWILLHLKRFPTWLDKRSKDQSRNRGLTRSLRLLSRIVLWCNTYMNCGSRSLETENNIDQTHNQEAVFMATLMWAVNSLKNRPQ